MSGDSWLGAEWEIPQSRLYVGLSEEKAVQLAQDTGVPMFRVLDSRGGTYTMDYRSDRLTILVHEGVVVKAAFC